MGEHLSAYISTILINFFRLTLKPHSRRKLSLITDRVTPYSKEAKKNKIEGYEDGLGGKIDDISAVCVVVS